MPATSSVSPSGDIHIDAILTGTKWASANLTYSFPTSASFYGSGYGSGEPGSNFAAFNAAQQAAVKSIYAMYSSVANVTFTEVTETSTQHATLRFAETDKYTTGFGYYPNTSDPGGDAWFGNSSNYFNNPVKGNYAYFTMIHEIGHTLGLKHAHQAMGNFGVMPSDRDATEFTVMSYRSYVGGTTAYYTNAGWSYPQTLMMYDIAALQKLYGANFQTNNTGTVYQWDPNTGELFVNGIGQGAPGGNQVFMTVWDGGGSDTYDFSNYASGVTVSLQPGEWSVTSAQQLANLGNGQSAVGNIANALLYQGNPASLIENAIGGSGNDTIRGNVANNTITGGGGNDWIDGLGGINTATYSGNVSDYHYQQNVDGSWTVADLRSGTPDGVDTLKHIEFLRFNDQTVDLGPCIEVITGTSASDTVDATHTIAGQVTPSDAIDMVYGMAGNDNLSALGGDDGLYGGDGTDTLYGGPGKDHLDGGSGADKMFGGTGDDTFVVDNTSDVITENANQGIDTIFASVSYTLAANLENLTLTGLAALAGTGNDLRNEITGNEAGNALNGLGGDDLITGLGGNDRLDGGAGADWMYGGTGNDTYVVDNAGDVADETAGDGIDTVQSSISFSLADTVHGIGSIENLTLTGTGAINATGNELNNVLIGNSAANVLLGAGGSDTLNGGAGADKMYGGTGNDTYVVDNAGDGANETAGDGIDTVQSSISFSLADTVHSIGSLENLTLTGTGAINATGNALENVLIGNSAVNVLIGGAGADTLDGGGGVDTASYYAMASSGVTVSLALGVGFGGDAEGDRLFNIENLTGTNFSDTLEGNAGNNVLAAGAGNDTVSYANATSGANGQGVTVNLALTTAQNTIRAGTDTLSGFENLTGSQFNDTLTGASINNVLSGLGGNDRLDGGAGADWMLGGTGNDTYVVDNAGDVADETAGDGIDTVQSSISFSLADTVHGIGSIENLTLTGTGAINATGNELNNVLIGNSAANVLLGAGGSDTLNGGAGADKMYGGTGNDTYVVDNAGDVADETAGDGIDTVQSSISFSLADTVHSIGSIENLTLTGTGAINATGNALENVLIGNSAVNVLIGGAGADTLDGGGGVDTASYYAMASSGVTVSLALGVGFGGDAEGDRLFNIENLTGTNFSDTLEGNAGNNVLAAGAGNDTVSYANATSGANGQGVTVNLALTTAQNTIRAGTDTLSGFENLTGSQFNDTLTGASINNVLTGLGGNDRLDGGAGADWMYGGTGNDTYVVDNAGDVADETAGDGIDTVQSSISFSLADTVHGIGSIENLTLTGTGAINATGNELNNVLIGNSAANVLLGAGGSDTLNGGAGADKMYGGTGNDTYVVDNAGDGANETAGDGIDTVQSSISFSLADTVHSIGSLENLTLTGTGAINATGNALENVLIGNSAVNVLIGGAGADTLDGGGGVDTASYYAMASSGVTVSLALGVGFGGDAEGDRLFNIENLTGTNFSDTLEGNAGNNVLAAGAGNDTVSYANATSGANGQGVTVNLALTTAQNTIRAGTDTLSGFENLTGSQFNDTLTGASINNVLSGLGGNDRLDGGAGADWMLGGTGNDTYVVDNAGDVADETAGDGIDTVQSSISFSLADTVHGIGSIENLTLTGTGAINATGNELNNVLIGNSAANVLLGAGGSDTLNGGAGADKMYGGTGNDTYVVDNAGDGANETAGDGIDTVQSSISFSLADTVHSIGSLENLTLTGTGAINATGNALENVLIGNSAVNVLIGGAGADTLDGGGGVDTASYYAMASSGVTVSLALGVGFGGDAEGDRLFNIENLTGTNFSDTLEGNAGNNVLAAGAGNDTVSYANATSGANGQGVTVNLALTTAQNTIRAGTDTLSGFENLTGSQFNDTLTGTSGNNTLTGLSGNDTLTGAGGNDTFVFLPGFGQDTITDFTAGPNSDPHDLIALDHTMFADFDAVVAVTTQVGANAVITVDTQHSITLVNVNVVNLHHDDFAFV